MRRAAHQIGPELFDSFLLVKRADVMAHHPDVIPGKLDYLRELEHIWQDVQLHGDCLSLKDLAVRKGPDCRRYDTGAGYRPRA